MTLRQQLEARMVSLGLSPEEATAAMGETIAAKHAGTEQVRWDDPAHVIPGNLFAILLNLVCADAIRWMDANAPGHVARESLSRPFPGPRGIGR